LDLSCLCRLQGHIAVAAMRRYCRRIKVFSSWMGEFGGRSPSRFGDSEAGDGGLLGWAIVGYSTSFIEIRPSDPTR
jgi:hypothetical protein